MHLMKHDLDTATASGSIFGRPAWWIGRTEDAISTLRAVLACNPRQHDARLSLGEVLLRAGRTEEAIDTFRTAVERHPTSARYLPSAAICSSAPPSNAGPLAVNALGIAGLVATKQIDGRPSSAGLERRPNT